MKKIVVFIAFSFVLASCERLFFEENLASSEAQENFDYLWNELDAKYSYFELKNIDWDNIRIRYQSLIREDMTEEELFNVLGAMMNELRDDHSNLVAPFNVSVYNVALRGKQNYNARTIDEFYLDKPVYTGAFKHGFIANKELAYLRYGSFMSTVDDNSLDFILERYSETKGLVLDLRENGGGSIFNIPMILERFSTESTLVGYTITRDGPNHSDFSEREAFYIGSSSSTLYEKPVMVLIDRGSYSATTFFANACKAFPNITLLGDSTGGGGGLPKGGQIPNGWTYRFSASQLLDLQGNNHAEDGVAPDIRVDFDWNDLSKDEILERALAEILQ